MHKNGSINTAWESCLWELVSWIHKWQTPRRRTTDKEFISVSAQNPVKIEMKPFWSPYNEVAVKHTTQGLSMCLSFYNEKGNKLKTTDVWIMSKTRASSFAESVTLLYHHGNTDNLNIYPEFMYNRTCILEQLRHCRSVVNQHLN